MKLRITFLLCLLVAGCSTTKQETASAVDLYYAAYHVYAATCYQAKPGNEMRWCVSLFSGMEDFRVSIDNMRTPITVGGDAKLQLADMKAKGARVLYLVKNGTSLRAPDPPRVPKRARNPVEDSRQASHRRNHSSGDFVAAKT